MAKTVSKTKLKAHMLRLFRDIENTGEELIVTDHGKPVLAVTPLSARRSVGEVFADLRGNVIYHESLDLPTQDEWDNP